MNMSLSSASLAISVCKASALSTRNSPDDPATRARETALNVLQKKRLEMAYVAAGGEIKPPDIKKSLELAYLAQVGQIQPTNGMIPPPHLTATGEIKQGDNGVVSNGQRKLVSQCQYQPHQRRDIHRVRARDPSRAAQHRALPATVLRAVEASASAVNHR
jgi:hypothetical protein